MLWPCRGVVDVEQCARKSVQHAIWIGVHVLGAYLVEPQNLKHPGNSRKTDNNDCAWPRRVQQAAFISCKPGSTPAPRGNTDRTWIVQRLFETTNIPNNTRFCYANEHGPPKKNTQTEHLNSERSPSWLREYIYIIIIMWLPKGRRVRRWWCSGPSIRSMSPLVTRPTERMTNDPRWFYCVSTQDLFLTHLREDWHEPGLANVLVHILCAANTMWATLGFDIWVHKSHC